MKTISNWFGEAETFFGISTTPHADLKQAKAILAAKIIAVLDERDLTVRKAASMTGFAAADFSRVRNAALGRFTLDRLMKMLARPWMRASGSRSTSTRGEAYRRPCRAPADSGPIMSAPFQGG